MFAKNTGFTSGLSLHYEPSAIVDNRFQTCASQLIVGERMLSIDFICAADARPVNIQDMLPADMRFKILTFVGNIADEATAARVRALAEQLAESDCFLQRYAHAGKDSAFDLICISASSKDDVDYTGTHRDFPEESLVVADNTLDFPAVFRSHWAK